MKRITCFILLIAIMLQVGGLMLFYEVARSVVHYRMHSTLRNRKEGLQPLTITVAELKNAWVKKNEILYNGVMYDIKSLTVSGNRVSMQVVKDKKEQKLIAHINKLGGKEKKQGDVMKRLMQLLTLDYMPPTQSTLGFCGLYTVPNYRNSHFQLVSQNSKILSPPPKFGK